MQFVILDLDGTDEEAMNRRLASRQAHIEMGNELTANVRDPWQFNRPKEFFDIKG